MQEQLKPLLGVGLSQEHRLLGLPDVLVGVGFPGNPNSTGLTFGAGAGLDVSDESYGRTRWHRWLSSLRYGTARVRMEWCLRVTAAAIGGLCLVLLPGAPALLRNLVRRG